MVILGSKMHWNENKERPYILSMFDTNKWLGILRVQTNILVVTICIHVTFCQFFSWAKTRMNSLCFTVRVQCLRHTKNVTYIDNHDKPCCPTRSCLTMHKEPSFIANADEWFSNMDESSIQLWKTVIVALQSLLQNPQNGKGVTIHLFVISLSFFMSQKCSFLRRGKSDIKCFG